MGAWTPTIIAGIIVALITGPLVALVNRARPRDPQSQIISDLREAYEAQRAELAAVQAEVRAEREQERAEVAQARAEMRQATQEAEARIAASADYITLLRAHITNELPPPPPEFPVILRPFFTQGPLE
ncbi:hypothetical protein AB0O80_10650 [Rothia kristinae]|uniref:hypothetical protein n=1 Tax=Actinomycetes TaxID=1760 RepID=UPI0034352071